MKKTLLFLSAVGCLVLPAISHADSPAAKSKKARKTATTPVVAVQPAPQRERLICYISPEAHTGSLIPMVRRSYQGRLDSAASPAVYGSTAIQNTGALDVGTALYRLDPSFTSGGRR